MTCEFSISLEINTIEFDKHTFINLAKTSLYDYGFVFALDHAILCSQNDLVIQEFKQNNFTINLQIILTIIKYDSEKLLNAFSLKRFLRA